MKASKKPDTAFLFDIKRYSINDGPGVRVTVFFKGCPLSCKWCHNPESQAFKVEKLYNKSKCIGCQSCVAKCPSNALSFSPKDGVVTDFSKCASCGACVIICPTKAIEMSGRNYTYEEIMKTIEKESGIIDSSGGGVTFSGGEPLMYPEVLKELLQQCGNDGIHRAVDTSGYVKPSVIEDIIPYTDLFLYDLKHMDSEIHKQWTGVTNEFILSNLKLVADHDKAYHIRIPLVKGVNADDTNLTATADFLNSLKRKPEVIGLLPYHAIAAKKYEKLGKVYNEDGMSEPTKEELEHMISLFKSKGLHAQIGG